MKYPILIVLLFPYFSQSCSDKIEKIEGNYYKQGDNILYAENGEDQFSYFFNGHKGILNGADIKTFKYLSNNYAKDKNQVYYLSFNVENADNQSFEVIGGNFAKDKNNIFAKREQIKNIDINTFSRLGEFNNDETGLNVFSDYYVRDKNNIFFLHEIVKDADLATFKPYQWNAMDKNHYYYGAFYQED